MVPELGPALTFVLTFIPDILLGGIYLEITGCLTTVVLIFMVLLLCCGWSAAGAQNSAGLDACFDYHRVCLLISLSSPDFIHSEMDKVRPGLQNGFSRTTDGIHRP